MLLEKAELMEYLLTRTLESHIGGVKTHPVTIIEAPMGFGKTTAVKQIIEGLGGLHESEHFNTRWLYVTDGSLDVFWSELCCILEALGSNLSTRLRGIGFPTDDIMRSEVIDAISTVVVKKPTLLIIDDMHLVDCDPLNQLLDAYCRKSHKDIRIIITTRFTSLDTLEELRVKGFVHFLGKSALEFTTEDIMAYFRMSRAVITRKGAEILKNRTEGWVSSLYLIRMEYLESGHLNISTSIFDLIDKVIYSRLSTQEKSFLQQMAMFPAFTLQQARQVWTNDDPAPLLRKLARRNAFISFNASEKNYRIHNLLSIHLMEQAEQEGNLEHLHVTAGKWYESCGQFWEAMIHYHKGGAVDEFLSVFEKEQGRSIHSDRKGQFIDMMEACPEQIQTDHPVALLCYAMNLMTFNEMALFEKACGSIGMAIATGEWDEKQLKQLQGEFEVLLSFTVFNDIKAMHGHLQQASELIAEPVRFMDRSGGWWSFGCPSIISLFHRAPGTATVMLDDFMESIRTYHLLTQSHGAGGEHVLEGEIAYLKGDIQTAEICAHKAMLVASRYSQPDIRIGAAFLMARCLQHKGDEERMWGLLSDIRDDISRSGHHHLNHTLEICEILLSGNRKSGEGMPQWLMELQLERSALNFPAYPYAFTALTRHLIESEQFPMLIGIGDELIQQCEAIPMVLPTIHIHTHLAIAYDRSLMKEKATYHLSKALSMAHEDGFKMPFVECFPWIESHLTRIDSSDVPRAFIQDIISMGMDRPGYNQAGGATDQPSASDLTPREREIVELAIQGLTNKAIGEKLYISTNTVKSSLKIIFEKQGIASRALLKLPTA